MLPAILVLGVSILGISLLFLIKSWEEKHARVFLPGVRLVADAQSLQFKAFLVWCNQEFKKLGPTSIRIGRVLLHDLALYLAALSRASERAAHNLADMVSHKHHFERKETKSEFLKQVGELPIRNLRDVSPAISALEEQTSEEPKSPVTVAQAKPVEPGVIASTPAIPAKKGKNGKYGKTKG